MNFLRNSVSVGSLRSSESSSAQRGKKNFESNFQIFGMSTNHITYILEIQNLTYLLLLAIRATEDLEKYYWYCDNIALVSRVTLVEW